MRSASGNQSGGRQETGSGRVPIPSRYQPLARELVDIVQQLSVATSIPEIAEHITRAVRRLTEADGAAFMLREGDQVVYVNEDAKEPLWSGRRFPMADCIGGWAMLNDEVAIIDDALSDPRVPAEIYRPTFVRSLVTVPVRTEDAAAAISVYWGRRKRASQSEINLIETVAHSASLSLRNLELSQSLHSAAVAREHTIASVGHDMRQPMQSLRLFASVLEHEDLSRRGNIALTSLQRALDRMDGLLNRILDLAQIEAGDVAIRAIPIQLDALLTAAVQETAAAAAEKGLTLRRVATSAWGISDPVLLASIVRSLLNNAIRYTERGGVVIGCRRHGGNVGVSIVDSGIGIPAHDQERVFQEFYQVGNQSREFEKGLGLGLTVAQHTARLLGHRIRMTSLPGHGSAFEVIMPAVTPTRPTEPTKTAPTHMD